MSVVGLRIVVVAVLLGALALYYVLPSQTQLHGPIVMVSDGSLKVRSAPATDGDVELQFATGTELSVECQSRGEDLPGSTSEGAMWLQLDDGLWVSESYISWSGERPNVPWCAPGGGGASVATASTDGEPLNVRESPDSDAEQVEDIPDGGELAIECQSWGSQVAGVERDTHVWLRLGEDAYISEGYVSWSAEEAWIPWCGQDSPEVPAESNEGFIEEFASAAQESMEETGVPASVTMAQAILETGWGSGALGREDHNIFGMKCFDDNPGEFALGCRDYATFECTPSGDCVDMDEPFRSYEQVEDSFRDHGALLSGWSHYADAMTVADDADSFAKAIHDAGYATDPEYSDKLISLMENYDLYQYD